jgi:hypothetical protein
MMRMQLDEMTQERDALQGRLDRHAADANKPLRVAPTHGIEHREIATLRASLAAAQAEAGALREALDNLMDWQNGPPLVTYTEGWTAAMEQARAALAREPGEGDK